MQPDPNALRVPDFIPPPDLTNVPVLIQELEDYAKGMDHEAEAHASRGAVSGNANPVFFFGQTAVRLRAAATALKSRETVPPTTPVVDASTVPNPPPETVASPIVPASTTGGKSKGK